MDAARIGLGFRMLRRRRRLRQDDVGAMAGLSQSWVSRLERGHIDGATVSALRAVAAALGARVEVRLLWQGEGLDRLLDADHAGLVDEIVAVLTAAGWECRTEVTFAIRGERGSIDVLARHPGGAVLVVEAKTVVADLQALQSSLDRKARLAAAISEQLGWPQPQVVGRLLVVRDARTARRRVADHRVTFAVAFPARAREVRRWLVDPASGSAANLRGLLFLPGSTDPHLRQRHRVRRPSGSG